MRKTQGKMKRWALMLLSIAMLLSMAACAPGTDAPASASQSPDTAEATPAAGQAQGQAAVGAEQLLERAYITSVYKFAESETFWAEWGEWRTPQGGEARGSELRITYKAFDCEEDLPGFEYRVGGEWQRVTGDKATMPMEQIAAGALIEVRFAQDGETVTESIEMGEHETPTMLPQDAMNQIWAQAKADFDGKDIAAMDITFRYSRADMYMTRWQLSAAARGEAPIAYTVSDIGGERIVEKELLAVDAGQGGECPPELAAQ